VGACWLLSSFKVKGALLLWLQTICVTLPLGTVH
jgi:hypothetical protein